MHAKSLRAMLCIFGQRSNERGCLSGADGTQLSWRLTLPYALVRVDTIAAYPLRDAWAVAISGFLFRERPKLDTRQGNCK